MNLKNSRAGIVAMIMPLIFLSGCNFEFETDQELVNKIWLKALEITGLPADTPLPEIAVMEEDIYGKLLEKDCESCEDFQKLKNRVKELTGKSYEEIYKECVEAERSLGRRPPKALGRAFPKTGRVEIYIVRIFNNLMILEDKYGVRWTNEEWNALAYSTFGHEMLHSALFRKGIPGKYHHEYMKELRLEKDLMAVISDHFGLPRKGLHMELPLRWLDAAINLDEKRK